MNKQFLLNCNFWIFYQNSNNERFNSIKKYYQLNNNQFNIENKNLIENSE